MKVLLCEDIKGTGWLGDIIEVKTGFARNYLLPQGLAIVPNEGNIKSLAQEKAKRAQKRIEDARRLQKAAEAVDGAEVVIAAKANEQGHLFGSVSGVEIAENLRKLGFTVADDLIASSTHIKEVGTSKITLRFDKDISATVNVVVVPQQDESSEPTEQKE
jgi:large subunit ribosomal protein L9